MKSKRHTLLQCPYCFSCAINKDKQPRIRSNDKLSILSEKSQRSDDYARKTVTNGWHMLRFFEKFLFDRQFLKIYLMYEGQIRQLDCLMLHLDPSRARTSHLKSIMILLHLSNPLLVSFEREMLQASRIFPSHFEIFSSSFAPCIETDTT